MRGNSGATQEKTFAELKEEFERVRHLERPLLHKSAVRRAA
jgi:hypothetical protein